MRYMQQEDSVHVHTLTTAGGQGQNDSLDQHHVPSQSFWYLLESQQMFLSLGKHHLWSEVCIWWMWHRRARAGHQLQHRTWYHRALPARLDLHLDLFFPHKLWFSSCLHADLFKLTFNLISFGDLGFFSF